MGDPGTGAENEGGGAGHELIRFQADPVAGDRYGQSDAGVERDALADPKAHRSETAIIEPKTLLVPRRRNVRCGGGGQCANAALQACACLHAGAQGEGHRTEPGECGGQRHVDMAACHVDRRGECPSPPEASFGRKPGKRRHPRELTEERSSGKGPGHSSTDFDASA